MRRIRRFHAYDRYNNVENTYEDSSSTGSYFLPGKASYSKSRLSSAECVRESPYEARFSSRFSSDHIKDERDSYYGCKDEENSKYESESDNCVEVYEVVSEEHLPSRLSYNNLPVRYSDHDIQKSRAGKLSPIKTSSNKILCKFCASSKQFGSCPCPIHLPTVQSRYLRQIQDNTRNAITINVFRNGDYRVTPTMLHIPKFHMRSMEDILKIVDKSVRFPVGYAYALYTVLGDLVYDPKELEPYEVYVVVNNCKKQFIPMEYGSKRSSMDMSRRRRTIPQSTFGLTSLSRA